MEKIIKPREQGFRPAGRVIPVDGGRNKKSLPDQSGKADQQGQEERNFG